MLNGMALCAGGGGLELGLQLALGDAYRTVVAVEREAAPAALLVSRQQKGQLSPFPIWDNLATFDSRPWRHVVDIVSGGIPCQPHSYAGKRLGANDARDLWPDTVRIIGECQPAIVFLENVPGVLPYVFHRWLPELQDMGYRCEAGIFSAEEVGAPHLRERVFLLAFADGARWTSAGAGDGLDTRGESQTRRGELADAAEPRCTGAEDGGADSGDARTDAGWRLEPERERTELAYADGSAGSAEQEFQPEERTAVTGRERGLMADAGNKELPQPGRRPDRRAGIGWAGAAVGDAPRSGVEGYGAGGVGLTQVSAGQGLSRCTIPLFPPYRTGDEERWAAVLRDWPNLAPAVERGVCGVDDELAGLSRAQWLRALGNGVVPLQAALAFTCLRARLEAGGLAG